MKTTYDVDVTQGIPRSINVVYKLNDTDIKDLTGYVGVGTVKKRASDCEDIGSILVEVTTPTQGEARITFPKSLFINEKIKATNPEERENFVYSAVLYKPDNLEDVIELISGLVRVSPSITKIPD
jgi:hypothetical protein